MLDYNPVSCVVNLKLLSQRVLTQYLCHIYIFVLYIEHEKSDIFSVLDASYLFHSTGWTWRAGTRAARRRCPTLGERAARSAQTSCSSTAAPTTRAAPHWRWRPTRASATPILTSTTTTPSASWTAASASCRSWRAATAPEPTSLLPVDPPVLSPVTLKQSGFILLNTQTNMGILSSEFVNVLSLYVIFLFGLINS